MLSIITHIHTGANALQAEKLKALTAMHPKEHKDRGHGHKKLLSRHSEL